MSAQPEPVPAPGFDPAGRRIVILSGFHDYRTARRGSIQMLADACVRLGARVSFVSTRFSQLSRRTGDSRLFLWDRANRTERVNDVDCYLWRTPLHPFAASNPLLSALNARAFRLWAALPNADFDAIMSAADDIIIESSVAAVFVRRLRRLNPRGRIIYFATDRLDTHGAHPAVQAELVAVADQIDHFALRARALASEFGFARDRLYHAEFGIHAPDFANVGASPYTAKLNAVSVGNGLFDADFYKRVAPHFPQVEFHLIGTGPRFEAPPNVHLHPEMPFRDTLPWLAHATIGLAPYVYAVGADYVAESSLKLAQFEYLGLPAVTADFATAGNPNRLGYTLGDTESMIAATRAALARAGHITPRQFLSWDDVATRVLDPARFPETRIAAP